jgi:hypothetical protein
LDGPLSDRVVIGLGRPRCLHATALVLYARHARLVITSAFPPSGAPASPLDMLSALSLAQLTLLGNYDGAATGALDTGLVGPLA